MSKFKTQDMGREFECLVARQLRRLHRLTYGYWYKIQAKGLPSTVVLHPTHSEWRLIHKGWRLLREMRQCRRGEFAGSWTMGDLTWFCRASGELLRTWESHAGREF